TLESVWLLQVYLQCLFDLVKKHHHCFWKTNAYAVMPQGEVKSQYFTRGIISGAINRGVCNMAKGKQKSTLNNELVEKLVSTGEKLSSAVASDITSRGSDVIPDLIAI